MRHKINPIAVILASLVLVVSAQASSLTLTPQDTGWSTNLSWAAPVPLTFSQFDPSFGTLSQVKISLTGDIRNGYMNIGNENVTNQTLVEDHLGAILTLKEGATTLLSANPNESYLGDVIVPSGPVPYRASISANTLASATLTSADPLFGSFIGLGTVGFSANSLGASGFSGGSGITFSADGESRGTVGITYIYGNPPETPELGTFALLGMSMLPMAGVAIRRRRKSA